MTFIMTLIVLVIERFFHWHHLRHWRWFLKYEHALSMRMGRLSASVRFIIILLPPVIIIGLLNALFKGWFYGIFQLIFGVVVLLYCLGPENLWVQVYQCVRGMNQEDPKAGIDYVNQVFNLHSVDHSQAFHREFVRAIFIAAHQRIFAVIFWFVILGPVGAVLYRLVELLSARADLGLDDIANQMKSILDWIPVRLFTFLFALGGHFTEVFAVWRKGAMKGLQSNESLLADCGIAALDAMEEGSLAEAGEAEKESLALLDRVFVMALVILAMIILII